MNGVFESETKMTKQQICDLIVLTEMLLTNADEIEADDLSIGIRFKEHVITVPFTSSIFDKLKNMCEAAELRKKRASGWKKEQ